MAQNRLHIFTAAFVLQDRNMYIECATKLKNPFYM